MAGRSIIFGQVDLRIAIGQGGTGAISFSQYRDSDNEGLEHRQVDAWQISIGLASMLSAGRRD